MKPLQLGLPMVAALIAAPLAGQTVVGTFSLKEVFGVSHAPQVVEFEFSGGHKSPKSHFMRLAESGQQMPWQQLSDGRILVFTHLPRSTIIGRLNASSLPGKDQLFTASYPSILREGMAFTLESSAFGLTTGNTYHVINKRDVYFQAASSYGGSALDLSSGNTNLIAGGFVCDAANDYIIHAGHKFQTGDPFNVSSEGTLCGGLMAQRYYAIRIDEDRIRAATSYANAVAGTPYVDITSAGSGHHHIGINWTFELVQGSPPIVFGVPVTVTSGGDYWEVANERAALRVRRHRPVVSGLGVSVTSGVATVTWSGHGLLTGDTVGLSQCTNSLLNAGYGATATGANTFTVSASGVANGSYTCTGQAHTGHAPLQGLRLPGGQWVATGPNWMWTSNSDKISGHDNFMFKTRLRASTMRTVLAEVGPLRLVVRIDYTFARPEYRDMNNTVTIPAGAGDYRQTITMERGRSPQLDYDTSMILQETYNFHAAGVFEPTMAGLLQHIAENCAQTYFIGGSASEVFTADAATDRLTAPDHGLLEGFGFKLRVKSDGTLPGGLSAGTTYYPRDVTLDTFRLSLIEGGSVIDITSTGTGTHKITRGNCDGHTDVGALNGENFQHNRWPEATSPVFMAFSSEGYYKFDYSVAKVPDTGGRGNGGVGHSNFIAWSIVSAGGTGWISRMFNPIGDAGSPVIGIAAGKASRLVEQSQFNQGPQFYSAPAGSLHSPPYDGSAPKWAGITFYTSPVFVHHKSATDRSRIHWILFVGEQGEFQTGANNYGEQPINPLRRDWNILGGINLTKLNRLAAVSDPPGGWKPLFLPSAQGGAIISKIKGDCPEYPSPESGCPTSWYQFALAKDPSSTSLLNAIRSGGAEIDKQIQFTTNILSAALDLWVNYGSIKDTRSGLTEQQGTRALIVELTRINPLLFNPGTTSAQRDSLKRWLPVIHAIGWDNDFIPNQGNSGQNTGTVNQALEQQLNGIVSASALQHDPVVTEEHKSKSREWLIGWINYAINEYGAGFGSSNYVGASVGPIVNAFGAWLNNAGSDGLHDQIDRLKRYCDFTTAWSTPVEPRYGSTKRKLAAWGDGGTQAETLCGMIGTLIQPFDAAQAAKAMFMWAKHGYFHSSFYGSTIFAVDDSLPKTDPAPGSATFPGFLTSHRSGWGTNEENNALILNGEHYQDHAHYERGTMPVYMLGAPIGINNSQFHAPDVWGMYLKNGGLVPEASFVQVWDGDAWTSTTDSFQWATAAQIDFAKFGNVSFSKSRFTKDGLTFDRQMVLAHPNASYPLLAVYDSFSGSGAGNAKILSWFNLATGAVTKPNGAQETPISVLHPVSGYNSAYSPNCGTPMDLNAGLNRWQFTGQSWPRHSSGGINWDLYTINNSGDQGCLGNWGVAYCFIVECTEFAAANGYNHEERQQILRQRGTGAFRSIFMPWKKGSTPTRTVSQESCGTQIVQGSETTCVNETQLTFANGATEILASFDAASRTAFGMTVSGGPQEVIRNGDTITWRISGVAAGSRTFTPPAGTWYADRPLAWDGSSFSIYHSGGAQPGNQRVTFSTTPSTVRSVRLNFANAGAASVRVRFGDAVNFVGYAPCSTQCLITVQAAPGTHAFSWEYLNSSGAVIVSSQPRLYVVE